MQDAVRKQYPILENRSQSTVQVQSDNINVSSIDRWAFISANKQSAIEVNQECLVYMAVEYPRFDGFSIACKQAVEMLVRIVEPSLVMRIGLRYSDLVVVDEDEKITDLVNDYFGIPTPCVESIGIPRQQSNDTLIKTDVGSLVIRTLYGHHNLMCLPDVQGLPVVMAIDDRSSERIILDFDHYWEATEDSVGFETSDVLEKLGMLHETSREAFWKITTDYARNEKWA